MSDYYVLTFIIEDAGPTHGGASPTRRTVRIGLSDKQAAAFGFGFHESVVDIVLDKNPREDTHE